MSRLVVWVGDSRVGVLDYEDYQFSFHYDDPGTLDAHRHLVSLTMPVRARAYNTQVLPPVFQSVLPEGELLSQIRARFGKAARIDDDFELLRLVGRQTIGRLSFHDSSSSGSQPDTVAIGLETVLRHPDAHSLLLELLERYDFCVGVAGVQPKALASGIRERATLPTSELILKLAGSDFPLLTVNEYFCLEASRNAGIRTARAELSDSAELLAVHRFDRDEQGAPLAFEEVCALLHRSRHGKYDGSYEEIAEVLRQAPCKNLAATLREFFAMVVLSMTVRNGDAHLRNFGVVYDCADAVELAPAYDIVTTTVYVAKDLPALTLGGRRLWPNRKILEAFGVHHCGMRSREVKDVLEQIRDAVGSTLTQLQEFADRESRHRLLSDAMCDQWSKGLATLNE